MPEWPKLSETLTGRRDIRRCQSCGRNGRKGEELCLWQECDEADHQNGAFLVLCRECEAELIEPHPRLYVRVGAGRPLPGLMPICRTCRHAREMACRSPLLLANGGPGLPLTYPAPVRGFMCSRGKGGGCRPIEQWTGAVECKGREEESHASA